MEVYRDATRVPVLMAILALASAGSYQHFRFRPSKLVGARLPATRFFCSPARPTTSHGPPRHRLNFLMGPARGTLSCEWICGFLWAITSLDEDITTRKDGYAARRCQLINLETELSRLQHVSDRDCLLWGPLLSECPFGRRYIAPGGAAT